MSQTLTGRIITGTGAAEFDGTISFDEHILAIEPQASSSKPVERYILPGFIDCHVHGGGGFDCMDGADAVLGMAAFHRRFGTTTILPTTLTAPIDDIEVAFAGIAAAMNEDNSAAGAMILGVHLEGPFINPEALGAQPPFAIAPDLALLQRWHAAAPIKVATFAPEIDPDFALSRFLLDVGGRPQLGHTKADAATAAAALASGYRGFTHLYNQMSGLHHRKPGCVGVALAQAEFAEIILDGQHVSETAAMAALRAIPKLYGVTDAIAATGLKPGTYRLGTLPISSDGTTARLADGTLAGSVATMDQIFRNFVGLGLSIDDAAQRCATMPADYLGLSDRGQLRPGLRADLVVLDRDLRPQATYVGGTPLAVN